MNAGTQAAKEAANIIDLDSYPTKLLDIVEVGKQIHNLLLYGVGGIIAPFIGIKSIDIVVGMFV